MKRHGIRLVSLALCAALVTALLPPALAWERTGEYREGLALASDGERYGYVQFDAVKEIDWFVDAFCRKGYGATIYRLRGDIVWAQ